MMNLFFFKFGSCILWINFLNSFSKINMIIQIDNYPFFICLFYSYLNFWLFLLFLTIFFYSWRYFFYSWRYFFPGKCSFQRFALSFICFKRIQYIIFDHISKNYLKIVAKIGLLKMANKLFIMIYKMSKR